MNPSEGRVPVSWDECADWLEAGGVVLVHLSDGWQPTTYSPKNFRDETKWNLAFDADRYRLLPPPNLVAAPEGMTAEAAGAVPDDVIEEVAQAIFADAFMGLVGWDDITEGTRSGWRDQAHAALSVPSVAEVFARDAKVREIVAEWAADEWVNSDDRMGDIASVVEGEMA